MLGQDLIIGNIEKSKVDTQELIYFYFIGLSMASSVILKEMIVGTEQVQLPDTNSEIVNRKPRNRKEARDVDFTKSLENDISVIFAPPKNPKSLTLPVNKATVVITLPEDCHYQPESLVKLFLLPNVMVSRGVKSYLVVAKTLYPS